MRYEKKECRRVKIELEQLKRQQPHAVDTPTSAEYFTQRVLELATRQQEVERRQREQRASLASSGEYTSSEYNNLSSNNGVSGDGSGHFRDPEVAGTEIINIRQHSRSPSTTHESSSHTPMQRRRPGGSVPTALFGVSQKHHRKQRASPTFGPVIYDDGGEVQELHRQWRTRHGGRDSNSSSGSGGGGYDSSGYDSSVGGSESDVY